MENVTAWNLDAWLVAKIRSVTDATEVIFARFDLVRIVLETSGLHTWKTLGLEVSAFAPMSAIFVESLASLDRRKWSQWSIKFCFLLFLRLLILCSFFFFLFYINYRLFDLFLNLGWFTLIDKSCSFGVDNYWWWEQSSSNFCFLLWFHCLALDS